jgi:hypothetical protein
MLGSIDPIVVFLLFFATVSLLAIAGTFVLIWRDGHGRIPLEPTERPWTAGNLPSLPYSQVRL